MRFVKNEVQSPRRLVAGSQRKSTAFYLLAAGVIILVIGTTGFFSAYIFRDLIKEHWNLFYRDVQTYALAVGGIGIIFYIIGGALLKVPLQRTTYYKITTIMKNKPFDPPRKGDLSKPLFARLRDLDDKWAFFTEIVPPECIWKIPQVITGPGGIFATCPVNEYPERRAFKDPGPEMERASKKLGNALGQQVTPILIFSNSKLVSLYKTHRETKARVMHIREIYDYFIKRKGKLSDSQREDIETKVFAMIQGTQPGAK